MTNTQEIINLKQKGYSQKEIAEKLNITQVAVSLQLTKAKEKGLFDGNSGSNISEISNGKKEISLEGQKAKLKGSLKCPYCRQILIPIDDVVFTPSELKETLKQHGYNYVCLNCKKCFARKSENIEDFAYVCPRCGSDVQERKYGKHVLYDCSKCQILFEKRELKKETKISQEKPKEDLNFVCPQCGGDISKTKSGKYRCPQCHMLFDKKELKKER